MDSVFQLGSTSKVTFASAGVSFLSSSEENLAALKAHLAFQTIGPNKVNQLRHVKFLQDSDTLSAHMEKHAALIRPRFESVLSTLELELAKSGSRSDSGWNSHNRSLFDPGSDTPCCGYRGTRPTATQTGLW